MDSTNLGSKTKQTVLNLLDALNYKIEEDK